MSVSIARDIAELQSYGIDLGFLIDEAPVSPPLLSDEDLALIDMEDPGESHGGERSAR